MRVAVIDDDPCVLDAICMLLNMHSIEAERFQSATEVLSNLDVRGISCIVTDLRMQGMTGLELLRQLRAEDELPPIILITGHGDAEMAFAAMKSGAFDFIEKPFASDRLLASIMAAIDHGAQVGRQIAELEDIKAKIDGLSDRQREVMTLMMNGYTNKQIGAELGISPRTVESYRAWVMQKLNVDSVPELVRKVMSAQRAN
jgi:two-component system response regulator FixJ